MAEPRSFLETRHLLDLRLAVPTVHAISGQRRFALIAGGEFVGQRLNGTVLPGGDDWISVRPDGAAILDARAVLQTDDGALIGLSWTGIRHGPTEVMERLARGEDVDPSDYYFRCTFNFETSDERYDWLNRIVAPASGRREPDSVFYSIFELL